MLWQDLIFGIGSILFVVALIPSVLSDDKPALGTSLTTMIILYVFAMTYWTLDLYFAAIVTLITATLWGLLALQKYEAHEHNE